MKKSDFTLTKEMIAQVRYYETLYKITDHRGETIFTGSEEMAKKILKVLKADALKRKKR